MSETPEDQQPPKPLLTVVRGNPDDVELAALSAVVAAAASGGGEESSPEQPSGWADKEAQLRGGLRHGPGAWRASAHRR
ncbi:acyl-CoA carboxylase subunit epsilon [Actinokineospora pegani]|uniref:acyl-CoA carboxylase subunit epsilon n=1 Tax=Actinokineospora pegani TaxID=2654637 RepID=UPI0012EA97CE|nr:acyl-CoA carboxylase subunit epsilon [Actinokineospora pegani]